MKGPLVSICILIIAYSAHGVAPANDVLPNGWTSTRFDGLIQKSPFAPATPTAAPVAPNFAANLYISSVAAIGEKYLVSVASREQLAKTSISTDEPSSDGLALVSVQYSTEVGKSKVTVKKGTETATLEFDQAALQQKAALPVSAPPPVDPQSPRGRLGRQFGQQPPAAGGAQIPVITPTIPVPPRAMLPQGLNPPNQAAPDTRRRIRIINSRPTQ